MNRWADQSPSSRSDHQSCAVEPALRPQVEQQLAGPRGHVSGDGVVGEHGGRR